MAVIVGTVADRAGHPLAPAAAPRPVHVGVVVALVFHAVLADRSQPPVLRLLARRCRRCSCCSCRPASASGRAGPSGAGPSSGAVERSRHAADQSSGAPRRGRAGGARRGRGAAGAHPGPGPSPRAGGCGSPPSIALVAAVVAYLATPPARSPSPRSAAPAGGGRAPRRGPGPGGPERPHPVPRGEDRVRVEHVRQPAHGRRRVEPPHRPAHPAPHRAAGRPGHHRGQRRPRAAVLRRPRLRADVGPDPELPVRATPRCRSPMRGGAAR